MCAGAQLSLQPVGGGHPPRWLFPPQLALPGNTPTDMSRNMPLGGTKSRQVTLTLSHHTSEAAGALQRERLTAMGACAEKGLRSVTRAELKHKGGKYRPQWEQTKKNPHPSSGLLLKTGRGGDTSQATLRYVFLSQHLQRQVCRPPPL